MLILGTNSIKDTGYNVANSCRFNSGSSDYLEKADLGTGSTTKATFSAWFKKSNLSSSRDIYSLYLNNDNQVRLRLRNTGEITIYISFENTTVLEKRSTMLLRDFSAWYHVVLVTDLTESADEDKYKIYINNEKITSYAVNTNTDATSYDYLVAGGGSYEYHIGSNGPPDNNFYDGYMAEVVLIDGLALAPTSFGEYDEDSPTIWKPIDVSGLTFGTNGFYLDFEDSSALGNDAAGSNNFTVGNLTATDQSTDTPTNNFATLNPLGNYVGNGVFTEGNLVMTTATNSHHGRGMSTIRPANGKWYAECKVLDVDRFAIGFMNGNETYSAQGGNDTNSVIVSYNADAYLAGSFNDYFDGDLSDDDIIMLALDLDNNLAFMGVNGTWANSATEGEIEAATATNSLTTHVSSTVPVNTGHVGMFIEDNSGTEKMSGSFNFGSPAHSISSGNADGNGYGNFEYAPPSGFLALCTKNLGSDGG